MSTPSNTGSCPFLPHLRYTERSGTVFSLFQRLVGVATVPGRDAAQGIWRAQAERLIPGIEPQLWRSRWTREAGLGGQGAEQEPGRSGGVQWAAQGAGVRVASLETAQALAGGFGLKSQVQVPRQAAFARSCLRPTETSCFFKHK